MLINVLNINFANSVTIQLEISTKYTPNIYWTNHIPYTYILIYIYIPDISHYI